MSLRERRPPPGLPDSRYFVSISRGDSIRTLMLRPAAVWALVALAPLSLAWGAAAAAFLAFHDDLIGAIVVRQRRCNRPTRTVWPRLALSSTK